MSQPNILFITSDQHRADALGSVGAFPVQTPHLDQLAAEGIRFDRAYADCPVCIPSRTTMVTGREAHRYGKAAYEESWRIDWPREDFLGSLLTRAGYQTRLVGKTHWHTDPHFRGGFEGVDWLASWRLECLRRTGLANHPAGLGYNELTPGLSLLPPELHSTHWCVERALEFLELRDRAQPFCLWLSFTDPHPPLLIHQPYYSMYDHAPVPPPVRAPWSEEGGAPYAIERQRQAGKAHDLPAWRLEKIRRVYCGMVSHLDDQLGRVFGKLQADRVWEETLIVYTSDHGEYLGDHGLTGKSSFGEASTRIPFILKSPKSMGAEPGRVSRALVNLADLLPTFLDFAGGQVPQGIDGQSLVPLITGTEGRVRDHLHGNLENAHMFLDGPNKYLYWVDDGAELAFDVEKDPDDRFPLGEEVLAPLRQKFAGHLAEEGHPHFQNGSVLNLGRATPPANVLRAHSNAGLAAVAGMDFIRARMQGFH